MQRYFIACAKGIEQLLFDELQSLGISHVKQTSAGCTIEAELEQAYRVALWSRLASRVLLELGRAEVTTAEDIQRVISQFDWQQVMDPSASLIIDFNGQSEQIRHTQFGAQVIKDGIVDFFTGKGQSRPSVDKQNPDIRIAARLHRDELVWSLDFSGSGLHRRGYRQQQGEAPLRENLAAAILYRAGIHEWLERPEFNFYDPFCGSGTLVIEAAMMALDHAPGLARGHWGFFYWKGHKPAIWHAQLEQAEQRFKQGQQQFSGVIRGSDNDPRLVSMAYANSKRLLLDRFIEFEVADATAAQPTTSSGLLVTNPPFGERLGEEVETLLLYRRFGRQLKAQFEGWQAAVLAGDESLLKRLKLRSHKKYRFLNGALEVTLANYDLTKEQVEFSEKQNNDIANRLQKNHQKLAKWAAKEGLDSWRLYDADLPDYNAAIDVYNDYLVVQEYAPPKTIPEGVARDRLWHLLETISEELPFAEDHIILKVRQRQSGSLQYQKRKERAESVVLTVQEYQAKFEVNLTDYLDTGLFLDHRLARKELFDKCDGLDVLNLFAYTCSASVQAALGGANRVVSVDMSKTYLRWGERNFKLNGLHSSAYEFIQADCFSWLRENRDRKVFDVIFLDPPTFSNSKRMDGTLDIQRDHVGLIKTAARLLSEDGVILFSSNRRKFAIDEAGLDKAGFSVNDQSQASIPEDFKRHKGIHHYFIISRI
ncbi:MAG: bifunctional 23S rRNA (guanine(2069)-N(7))-methyltransferase RlmK/23S rRNA (guanine(2445)-N(2))-methyltransferase RlmL [Pseudomonadota bacterium]